MQVIALIPARGGSKGVPRKAVKMLGNHPMIAYTIRAAIGSGVFSRVFVTTEDQDIKQRALLYGAEVLDRPVELAGDETQTDEVFLYCLRQLEVMGIHPDVLGLLQPTSPFRDASDIALAWSRYRDWYSHSSLHSVGCLLSVCYDGKFHWTQEGLPIRHNPEKRMGRQWKPAEEHTYAENGAIYFVSAKRFSLERTYRLPPYHLSVMDESHATDVDTMADFEYCQYLMERNANHTPG